MIITRITLGLIAMAVSFYFSWVFIVGAADNITSFLIAAAFVVVSEGAKILLFADGMYSLKHTKNKEWGAFALGVSAILIFYSILATAYNFTVANEPFRQAELTLAKATAKLEQVRMDIDSAKFHINQCETKNYLTNCVEPEQNHLKVLAQRETETLTEIKELQAKVGAITFWNRLGNDKAQTVFNYSRGIILELLGLILLSSGLMQVRESKGVHLGIPEWLRKIGGTQLDTDTSVRNEAKSINEWVSHLRKQGIDSPSISYLKNLGMGQEKAQKIKAVLALNDKG